MQQFRILLFLIFNSFAFLLSAQGNKTCLDCLETAKPEFYSVWYNVTADVFNDHVSGLLLIKFTSADSVYAVFTSQTGVVLFNYLITENKFNVLQAAGPFKKKAIRNRLTNDIRHFLVFKPFLPDNPKSSIEDACVIEFGKETVKYIPEPNCLGIVSFTSTKKNKAIMKHTLGEKQNGAPIDWRMEHQSLPFTILLSKLQEE